MFTTKGSKGEPARPKTFYSCEKLVLFPFSLYFVIPTLSHNNCADNENVENNKSTCKNANNTRFQPAGVQTSAI